MEVRWRLFARDVLSMTLDDDGGFMFGRPPRPVRGLRVLGVVVHRSSSRSLLDLDKGAAGRTGGDRGGGGSGGGDGGGGGGGASDGGDGMHDEYGSLAIDDGTGVIDVRLPLRLWDTVALHDQVDIVGTPERGGEWGVSGASPSSGGRGSSANSGNNGNNAGGGTNSAGSGINSANRRHRRRRVRGEGCCVETDPNASTLRALECINLYKTCYFSRAWSPSASTVPLPPLRPDPSGETPFQVDGNPLRNGGTINVSGVVDRQDSEQGGGGDGGKADGGATLEERLLGMVESTGGATREQLIDNLGVSPGGEGEAVTAALAEMQLHGAIYLAGDRYMAL